MGGMWTKEHRARQAAFERRRHPTDLTDAAWARIEPLLPRPAQRGRKPGVDLREILNGLRYLARAGCALGRLRPPPCETDDRLCRSWRMPPRDFGPWQTVYGWFRRFVRRLLLCAIHDLALMLDRERMGRSASPSAGVLDSQTVKAPAATSGGGYDAAKRLKGRKKRHIAVDADGRLLMVNLTSAGVEDAAGAERIITAIRQRWPLQVCGAALILAGPDRRLGRRWPKHLFADGAYDRGKLMSKAAYRDVAVEVVRKLAGQQGFQPLPRRWVVEVVFTQMTKRTCSLSGLVGST